MVVLPETSRNIMVGDNENDNDVSSALGPPRKKLRQALLPFQILSPGGGAAADSPAVKNTKKRKLSEGSEDDIKVIKVVKSKCIDPLVESKENLLVPVNEPGACKNKEVNLSDEDKVAHSVIDVEIKEPSECKKDDENVKEISDKEVQEPSEFKKSDKQVQEPSELKKSGKKIQEPSEIKKDDEKKSSKRKPKAVKSLPAKPLQAKSKLKARSFSGSGGGEHVNKDDSKKSLNLSDQEAESNEHCSGSDKTENESKTELGNDDLSVANCLLKSGTSKSAENSPLQSKNNEASDDSSEKEAPSKGESAISSTNESATPSKQSKNNEVSNDSSEKEARSKGENAVSKESATTSEIPSEDVKPETSSLYTPKAHLKKSKQQTSVSDEENDSDDEDSDKDSPISSKETPDSSKSLSLSLQKTPNSANKNKKLTPKQLLKQVESAKKKEERERLKQEKERKKAEEKEEKQREKLKKVEEKEKKKQAELEAQKMKLEQKKKEKEEKEKKKAAELELKSEEKRKKEELRLLEKRKKEEKKLAEEEARKKEEEAKRKVAAAFTSFFVAVKPDSKSAEEVKIVENFMPFEVKADMRLARHVRTKFDSKRREALDVALSKQEGKRLYLDEISGESYTPGSCGQTWPLSELRDEVCIIDDDDDMMGVGANNIVIDRHPVGNIPRQKLLQFWDNRRPPYWGTWRKKSSSVKPRVPFGKDEKLFDYEVDSDEEWEEEEPGESLHGSDDEKESEDEYEVDNDFFVPHGYLSEEENEHEEDEKLSPETMKAKLKLLEIEFQEEMKQKTECIKPRVIGCIWLNNNTDPVGSRLMQLLSSHRAVFRNSSIVTSMPESEFTDNSSPRDNVPGPKKRKFPDEAIPALIKLIHGNVNGRLFLVKEFHAYMKKEAGSSTDSSAREESKMEMSDTEDLGVKTKIPEKDNFNIKEETPKKDGESGKSGISEKDTTNARTDNTGFSKKNISNKIKELSSWVPCPEEGVMQGRCCWYVPAEIRAAYGLQDLKLPNKVWNYCFPPKKELDFSNPPPSPAPTSDIIEKPTKVLPLITKFTKKMTSEELKKQLDQSLGDNAKRQSDKQSTLPASTAKLTTKRKSEELKKQPDQSQGDTVKRQSNKKSTPLPAGDKSQRRLSSFIPKATNSSPSEDKPRKRVPILMSVSVGQQIPKARENKKCEPSLPPKSLSLKPKVTSIKTDNKEVECVVLSD